MKLLLLSILFFNVIFAQNEFPGYPVYPDYFFIAESEYEYQAESIALFARMTTEPDEARKQLIDGLITNLKTAGLWSGFDCFWIFAAHDEQAALLNWIEDNHNCIEVDDPAFEIDRGYTGGPPTYLTTGFNPSTADGNFSLNSSSIGVYSRIASTGALIDIGCYDFSAFTVVGCRYSTTNTFRSGMSSGSLSNFTNANSLGLHVVSRVDNSNLIFYKNAEEGISVSNASVALTNEEFFVLAANSVGTPQNFTNRQIALAFIGRSLTENEKETLFNIIETYLDAIGAGVVD